MVVTTPTLTSQRWGRDPHHVYDYYANPIRMVGGNPCIIHRHGGGANTGNVSGIWDSANGEVYYLWNYLSNNASLAQHFDLLSIGSGQRVILPGPIRSSKVFILDAIREFQAGTAEVRRIGKIGFGASNQYKIDPNKCVVAGDSFGGTVAMLSQLFPPYIGSGGQITHMYRPYASMQFSSQVRAVVNHIGQIDARTIAGIDQQAFTNLNGWFGTSGWSGGTNDGGTEFTAFPNDIKAAASVRAYIQNGNTEYYRPFFNLYNSGFSGGHTHPYTEPHDWAQLTEIYSDLNNAGLLHGKYLYNPGDLSQAGGTGPRAIAAFMAVYNFIAARITENAINSSLPVP